MVEKEQGEEESGGEMRTPDINPGRFLLSVINPVSTSSSTSALATESTRYVAYYILYAVANIWRRKENYASYYSPFSKCLV